MNIDSKNAVIEKIHIRPLERSDRYVLEDLLYEAIFQPKGSDLLPKCIIFQPEIYNYIDHFGYKSGDAGFLACINDKIIGGVWVRILHDQIKGYGNIDQFTPEFAIALFPAYRQMGIGTCLMNRMIAYLKTREYGQVSLSVNKNNYATKMYLNLGFEIVKENEDDYLMVLKLEKMGGL